MWPYDYHGEQYTPLLWWSEGVTDYYADLTNLRAGLWSVDQFLANTKTDIDQVESIREPWSVEDGSEATWINEVYINSSQLYYPKGAILGMLLDISIRDATENAHTLDQVMRTLYTKYYRQSRGFSTADLLNELRAAGMPDVDTFYRRYIDGRDSLPYETVVAKAGLLFHRDLTTNPFIGVSMGPTPSGALQVQQVTPGSSAEEAGVQPGDLITNIGGIAVASNQDWGGAFRSKYHGKAGQPLTITVQRAGQTLTLNTTVRDHTTARVSLSRVPTPTPKQAKIWQGLASVQ
jgi:predicted metalloprotease with PDZ domain